MRLFFFVLIINFSLTALSENSWRELLAVKPVLSKMSDSTSMYLWSAGVLSTLLVKPSDDQIRDSWRDHQTMSKSISSFGDFLGSSIPGVMIVGGQYLWDTDNENWKTHARALIWESAIVTAMKYSFARQRPGGSQSHLSFPSGHTATAFATATALSYTYGWKTAVVAYPLAMLVGLSRLADDAHWGSDVVAGAFVGFISARASVPDETYSKVAFIPFVGPEASGLTCVYSF